MSLKNILVHFDDSPRSETRLALGVSIAQAHEAHLTGVYAMAPPYIPAYMAAQVGATVFEAQAKLAQEAAEEAHRRFSNVTSAAGISAEWRAVDGRPADVVILQSRYADLSILGQPDPDEPDAFAQMAELPADVLLDSGRPILAVPYAGQFDTIGRNVLVAWNATRESARAVNDALPFLQKADKVTVMHVNAAQREGSSAGVPGADIALHLARHHVTAEAAPAYAEDLDIADVLLSRAADLGVDLIVMGAYGRSRLRELVLGGATRDLLRHMTVPLLMSH